MLFVDYFEIAKLLRKTHDLLRNKEGLQPTEAFDALSAYFGARLEARTDELSFVDLKRFIKQQELPFQCSEKSFNVISTAFAGVSFLSNEVDFISAGLRSFLSGNSRKSLGIFLTPEVICDLAVQTAFHILGKKQNLKICDPACGAGTFLVSASKFSDKSNKLYGSDISQRMALLARLNTIAIDHTNIEVNDSIGEDYLKNSQNSFDLIITNPPFGSEVSKEDNTTFGSLFSATNRTKLPTELAFITRSLELLADGGILAIVVQKGVFTNVNDTFSNARKVFSEKGEVIGIFELPPETFYATGTQSNTVLAFVKKIPANNSKHCNTWRKKITSIGVDGTGRSIANNEAKEICLNLLSDRFDPKEFQQVDCSASGWEALKPRTRLTSGKRLGELFELVRTGNTPARSKYTDNGVFIIKVGNLTGKGINFEARDRNFVSSEEARKREKHGLILRKGDLLMTSSAHAPKYIAKKVDIFDPPYAGIDTATFVGEIMLVRPKLKLIDPYKLLFFFRLPQIQNYLQESVIGQTAHLSPESILDMRIDPVFYSDSENVNKAIEALKEESKANKEQFVRSTLLANIAHSFQNLL